MLTEELKHEIDHEAAVFEQRRGACIDALRVVQRHRGWVDDKSVKDIAAALGMSADEVDSVATFYNLILRKPVGRHVIRLCTSVSCWIMGSEMLVEYLQRTLGIGLGETTKDNRFTLIQNQCLGTCDHAPALMIDDDLYRDLDPEKLEKILAQYQ